MVESGSSIAKFMECPRKYEYAYEKMLGSIHYRSALGYGSFVHAGVEALSGGRINAVALTMNELLDKHVANEARDEIGADMRLANRVVSLWSEFWESVEHPFSNKELNWQHSEFEWKYELKDSEFVHVGKSDGVVLYKKYDKFFLYELKTAADRSRETYVHRLQVDKQISSNILALRAKGIYVEGVVYDIIWKPGLKRKTERKTLPDELVSEFHDRIFDTMKEEPANYFQREIVYRTNGDLAEYERDLRAQFEAIYIARKKNAFYRNSGACENFGSLCEFFSACIEGKKEMEQLLHRRDRRLPELTKDIQ